MMLVYHKTKRLVTETKVRAPEQDEIVWIRLQAPKQDELLHVLRDLFHCHPLLVEDCIKLNQRPKMDRYKDQFFISFYALTEKLATTEFATVIGENFVITVHNERIPFLDELSETFRQIEGHMEFSGRILYHILDRCVDEYAEHANQLDNRIDKMEQAIYRSPYARIARDIFHMKRTLHRLRRIFTEERTLVGSIVHQNFPYIRQESDVYFVDIYDHVSRIVDSLDIYRESLDGLLELQMNMKSDRMNEIMKTLTVVSTIFMPLTFIVGVYGMNFHKMPELDWNYGYLAVWIVMLAIGIGLWMYYKKKKWL
ncbi:magnesium/cobalt transporter CorA [Paenibacillus ginsengarvi]|nr:magnesium/cobalt transporter CorA [Paenibacillus ginsengarvi]